MLARLIRAAQPRRITLALCCLAVALLLAPPVNARPDGSFSSRIAALLFALRRAHYAPDRLDNASYMRRAAAAFLHSLDPQGLYFLEDDVNRLKALDPGDARSGGQSARAFFELSVQLYRARLVQSRSLIGRAAANSPDFAAGETLELFDAIAPEHPESDSAAAERWRRFLRAAALNRVYFAHSPESLPEFQEQLRVGEAAAHRAATAKQLRAIEELLNAPEGLENRAASQFLRELAAQTDPHSEYFTPEDMRRFQTSLSTRADSFGFVLEKTPFGEMRIQRLIPGGPAWRSGRLNQGDAILSVTFPDENGRRIEASDLGSPYELEDALTNARSRRIILSVKKTDGRRFELSLYKEGLALEDNAVSGFVLEGERRLGYIYLPAFYSPWESPGAPGCASDVAREILNLQRENIGGLILDLRDNGGGSLQEAADLAGLFINQGPLFIQQDRAGELRVLRDPNRGAAYEGPLLVLLNGRSASAAEFFAAAMRNYRRALLVGGATFGKASSQIALPLSGGPEPDFLKVTTHLYYHLDGATHQGRGLAPDIELPDPFARAGHEEDLPHALPARRVQRAVQFQPLPPVDIDPLADASRARVRSADAFRRLLNLSDALHEQLEEASEVPLNTEEYFASMQKFRAIYNALQRETGEPTREFTVRSPAYEQRSERIDPYRRARNTERRAALSSDILIEEAYRILRDYMPQFEERARP